MALAAGSADKAVWTANAWTAVTVVLAGVWLVLQQGCFGRLLGLG
jgi:hypothetical protein